MKTNLLNILGAVCSVAMISPCTQAQTETLLESFEDGIGSLEVVGGGGRSADDIKFSQYTKAGADDTRVTHGDKALKVTLTTSYGYQADGDFTFSAEASNLLKQAWATHQEARYLLRYDVEFPTEGVDWGNFILVINGWDYAQLEQGGAANRSMSIPLDLVPSLGDDDLVTVRIIDQYGVPDAGAVEMLEVFVDNFRLVDTYVPGAVPEVTLLNGFDTEEDVSKVEILNEGRAEASLHVKTGADDLAVTQGEGSLEIKVNEAGGWSRDFVVPFRGTIMESIARLPLEARLRYTLRFDVIFEDQSLREWGNGNWQNLVLRTAGGGAQNFAMHRIGSAQHVVTYSAPLDQLDIQAGDPAVEDDTNPGLSFVNQGGWTEFGMTYHFDNFRVIDTGKAPLAIGDLVINADGKAAISWKSSDSQAYALDTSSDLIAWNELVTDVLGEQGAESTSYVDAAADLSGQKFYRVRVSGVAPPLNEGFENGFNGWTAIEKTNNGGATAWEVGEPSIGVHSGSNAAGTDLDGNYADATHIALQSPEVDLLSFIKPPTMTLAYYLDADADAAARINILDPSGGVLEEGAEDNGLFFVGNSEGWQELSVTLPVFGQKVIIEFEFVDAGQDSTNGAGFFIDDVLISASE